MFAAMVLQEVQTWQRRSGAWRGLGMMKSWSGKQSRKIWAHSSTGKFLKGEFKSVVEARTDFWGDKSICGRWSSGSWISDSFESRFC